MAYGLPAPLGTWVSSGGLCQQGGTALSPPCDLHTIEALLGQMVSTIAPGTQEDEDYPFWCPPGVVGDRFTRALAEIAAPRPSLEDT